MTTSQELDLAWLGGIIDGEGCIVSGDRGVPRLAIAMTDRDAIEEAARIMGCSVLIHHRPSRRNEKLCYVAALHGARALSFFDIIRPYLRIQRRLDRMDEVTRVALARPGQPRGSRAGGAKLREAYVPLIRGLVARGITQVTVAGLVGVDPSCVNKLVKGETWSHVP